MTVVMNNPHVGLRSERRRSGVARRVGDQAGCSVVGAGAGFVPTNASWALVCTCMVEGVRLAQTKKCFLRVFFGELPPRIPLVVLHSVLAPPARSAWRRPASMWAYRTRNTAPW